MLSWYVGYKIESHLYGHCGQYIKHNDNSMSLVPASQAKLQWPSKMERIDDMQSNPSCTNQSPRPHLHFCITFDVKKISEGSFRPCLAYVCYTVIHVTGDTYLNWLGLLYGHNNSIKICLWALHFAIHQAKICPYPLQPYP